MLDQRYFLYQEAFQQGKDVYQGYVTKYPRSTMVLCAKETDTPLAALILSTPRAEVQCLLTARAPPTVDSDELYFQGMLNQPGEPLDLSMVNLHPEGYLNFNVLHTPHHVNQVDPGPAYGVNRVNELAPNSGYTIAADQRTGRQMILQGLTRLSSDGQEEKVTVSQDESGGTKQGLYFYLSVVPALNCPGLIELFRQGTYWRCVDTLIRQTTMQAVHQEIIATDLLLLEGTECEYEDEDEDQIGQSQAGRLDYGEARTVDSEVTGLEYAYDCPSQPTVLCVSLCPHLTLFPLPDLEQEMKMLLKQCESAEQDKVMQLTERRFISATCVLDLESEPDTVVCQCGHQCLNAKNVMSCQLKVCPVCRGPIAALIPATLFARE